MPRKHRIIRRFAYACIALAILIAAAWVASGWYGCVYVWGGLRSLSLAAGWIEYDQIELIPLIANPAGMHPSTVLRPGGSDFWLRTIGPLWRFDVLYVTSPMQVTLGLPFWPVAALLAALGALLLYITRPRPPHLCPKCKYDLRGLPPNSPCPECGRAASAPAPP